MHGGVLAVLQVETGEPKTSARYKISIRFCKPLAVLPPSQQLVRKANS